MDQMEKMAGTRWLALERHPDRLGFIGSDACAAIVSGAAWAPPLW